MKRWLEEHGYALVWRLALRRGRIGRWLHDHWSAFWYRHYCPYPVIHDLTARACIAGGHCGCSNGTHRGEDDIDGRRIRT